MKTGECEIFKARSAKLRVPVTPYSNAIPRRMKELPKDPIMMYLKAPSIASSSRKNETSP